MPASEPSAERRRDCERLAAAVRDAGAVALKYFRGELKSWTKGKGDSPVTEADIASNDLLRERLLAPGDGWLSEESENDPSRLDARRVWVVDPIDGTRAYIAGREDWSISAALVEAGRPVVAALYAPATDELFLATRGRRRDPQRRTDPGERRRRARRRPHRRPQAHDGARRRAGPGADRRAAHPFAGAASRARGAKRDRRAPSRAAAATTGTLRLPIFWCTKPAGR